MVTAAQRDSVWYRGERSRVRCQARWTAASSASEPMNAVPSIAREAGMALLADDAEVREDVVEATVERDLDGVDRNALSLSGPLETAQQIAAERPQHVLHRART